MKRKEWIKFFSDRIACTPKDAWILFDMNRATSLLNALYGATEEKTADWIKFYTDKNGIRYEQCSNCNEYTIGLNKAFCPYCGAKMI